MEIEQMLKQRAEQVEEALKKLLPEPEGRAATIMSAMTYGVCGGGKRLRPVMLVASYELFGGTDSELALLFGTALELIHTYSLIHDDLPAMDNDDYRRGRETTHRVYGEAMGILAGDALLNFAFELVTSELDHRMCQIKDGDTNQLQLVSNMISAFRILAQRPGISGMIGGQVLDMEMEQKKQRADRESLQEMFEKKTGALLMAALEIGCILAGGSESDRLEMAEIGRLAGLAFQIQDDILDVTGEEEKLGKPLHSDEKNQKTTWVSLHGLDQARRQMEDYSMEAIERMKKMEQKRQVQEPFLSELLLWLIHREY